MPMNYSTDNSGALICNQGYRRVESNKFEASHTFSYQDPEQPKQRSGMCRDAAPPANNHVSRVGCFEGLD